MAKKNKKRQHSRTVDIKRQMEQEKLAEEKDRAKKRLDPTARALLYGDLIFLALSSLLYANHRLSDFASGLCTVMGAVLLILALWIQFGRKKDRDNLKKGPRL